MSEMAQFKDLFLMEAEEHIQKLNDNILILEKIYSKKTKAAEANLIYNEMMRSSHTIKGSSASMGYVKLAYLTHVLEDIFDSARNGKLVMSPDIINQIFNAVDNIEKSVNVLKEVDTEPDTDALANELKKMTGVNTVGVGKSVRNADGTPVTDTTANAEPVVEVKAELPAEVTTVADGANCRVVCDEPDTVVEASKISYIKVPVDRLESLMDLVEELLIDKMRLEQFAIKNKDIREVSNHISLLVSGIQFQVTQTRLVPLEQVFARFPRMIRDLALKQNKKIDFQIIGNEIELDRTIIDKIGEPLIHLLRNAVDHGISKEGHIVLKAARESDRVLFIVENDDTSIDLEKVRQAAIKRSILTAEEAKTYSDEQLKELLVD